MLADIIDPRTTAYKDELARLERERLERQRFALLTTEEKEAEAQAAKEFQNYISGLNVNTLRFNQVNPAAAVLTNFEQSVMAASVAGNFLALNKLMPFSIHRWNRATPLGKYRFRVVNGKRIYIPFSDSDIDNFMAGSWLGWNGPGQINGTLVEPGAQGCDKEKISNQYKATQKANAQMYPQTDWRHIVPIYPGAYICQVYRPSTWVKIRGPVMVAVAAVAAVYLGPVIYDKIAGAVSGATSTAESATVFQKVQATANNILGYVNKARTIEAIANGELPPPPISILGDSFTDWALTVAKKELTDAAKEKAAELGQEYIQRKLTEKEENKLRAEIQAMQAELAALMPADVPAAPDAQVPAVVQEKSAELALQEKQAQDSALVVAGVATIAGLFLLS